MESTPIYFRIKKPTLKIIDQLVSTRIYKDRQHFIEVSILKEIQTYDKRN